MPEVDEIKDEVVAAVDSELDAWDSFYETYKEDYGRITEYEKKIERLQEEIKRRDKSIVQKLEREKGTLFFATIGFFLASGLFITLLTNSLNVWLYFFGGFMIGLGVFSLLYLWTR